MSDKKPNNSFIENPEYWMTNLPENIRDIPIIHIAIPGSHDSFTCNITRHSEIAPDAGPTIQNINCCASIVKCVTANWSHTQDLDVGEQLRAGIRYFDLRLSTKKDTDEFYFVHKLYGDKVMPVMNEMADFLRTHPKEVIILDCQHFYDFSYTDHNRFAVLLKNTFQNNLLPFSYEFSDMKKLTLNFLTDKNKYQALVVYRHDSAGQFAFWPTEYFPTPWPNTLVPANLISELEHGLKTRPNDTGYVTQLVLTPTHKFAIRNFWTTLRAKCVATLTDVKYDWLSAQKPGPNGVNVVIADYINADDFKFVKCVIALNLKLLDNETDANRKN